MPKKIDDYKIIIINPEDVENKLEDGNMDYIGRIEDNYVHVDLLIDYGLKTYGEKSIFGILSDKYTPDVPIYFLTMHYQNIVFLNIPGRFKSKRGLLYMPEIISKHQRKSLGRLFKQAKGYDIELNHSMRIVEGVVESETAETRAENEKMVDKYLKEFESSLKKNKSL